MSNDKAVEDRLGEDFVSKILDHASEGMEESDLKQIARKLGEMSDPPNRVLGAHKGRMSNKKVHHRVEMREILSDFWNVRLFDMTREEGRCALIEVFKNPDLVGDGNLDLAKKLEEITGKKATVEKPSAETTAAEKIESVGGSAWQTSGGHWGTRTGTEEDMEALGEIIKDELKLPSNKGKPFNAQIVMGSCLRVGRGIG